MMQFIKANKITVIGGILLLGLVFVYFAYFSGSSSEVLLTTGTEETSPVSKDLLITLSNLHTIQLNTAIFDDPAFESLSSFGVDIPPETIGRRNPFAPL